MAGQNVNPVVAAGACSCPLCGEPGRHVFDIAGVAISQCDRCIHRFAAMEPSPDHVSRHYDDDYFFAGNAGYSDYLASEPLLRRQGQWYAELFARFAPQIAPSTARPSTGDSDKPRLFAVGAAAGFDSDEFRRAGWRVSGVEPNDTMARHARQRFGIDIQTGTLESVTTTEPYDLVTAIQVMAHFTDPQLAAQRLAALVRPGGYVLIETWDYRSRVARCCGRYWHEYSPPTVLQWFSKASLKSLMQQHGLRQAGCGRPVKRIGGAHARSLLQYKLSQMPLPTISQALLNLVPATWTLRYPGDDLFWALYQKQE